MYEAAGHRYFKVPVAHGVRLVTGAVPDTCQKNGMEAVCFGSRGCHYNSARCYVTPLIPRSCEWGTLMAISRLICNGQSAHVCPRTNNMFTDMHWRADPAYGECGNIHGVGHCIRGSDYVSGPENTYFAFCVER